MWSTMSPPNQGPQSLRIRRDLQEHLGGCAKEEVIHGALVDEGHTGQRLGYGEDQMDVADGQELLLARRHPLVPSSR